MAVVRVNPVGMTASDEGFITAMTVVTGGSPTALSTTDLSTLGTIDISALAATSLVQDIKQFKLVTG
jgi:hypothetical protein